MSASSWPGSPPPVDWIQNSKAAGGADARDRRWRDRKDQCLVDAERLLVDVDQDRARILEPGIGNRLVALLEILQRDEQRRGVRLEALVDDAVAVDDAAVEHPGRLPEDPVDLIADLHRAIEAGRVRHDDRGQHVALVLQRHEAGRRRLEQCHDRADEHREQHQRNSRAADRQHHEAPIGVRELLELAVEPAEEAGRPGLLLLEHQCAHRRRQRQRDKAGDRDGDDDGDRELLVELARGAGQKRRRHEHGAQHQHDSHDRSGNFLHRADRRVPRRQAVLVHVAVDVLDDDDRIVDHHADRQDQSEERQQVE